MSDCRTEIRTSTSDNSSTPTSAPFSDFQFDTIQRLRNYHASQKKNGGARWDGWTTGLSKLRYCELRALNGHLVPWGARPYWTGANGTASSRLKRVFTLSKQ